MKKLILSIFPFVIFCTILFIGFEFLNVEQHPVVINENHSVQGINFLTKDVLSSKTSGEIKTVDLFKYSSKPVNAAKLNGFVKSAVSLTLTKKNLENFYRNPVENLTFRIPSSDNSYIELELIRSNPFSNSAQFSTITSNGKQNLFPDKKDFAIFYKGYVKGDEKSIATISVTKDEIIGIVSVKEGNYNLVQINELKNNGTLDYLYYNDADLLVKNPFKCRVNDEGNKFVNNSPSLKNEMMHIETPTAGRTDTLWVYFETDYKLFQDKGSSNINVLNYVAAIFNEVQAIYSQILGIRMGISGVAIWTQPDVYLNFSDSYNILTTFGSRYKDNFYGNFAHLLSTRNNGSLGGIAWIKVLCRQYNSADSSGRYGFSNIINNYSPYPTYSWTIEVITHELGHNYGSRHTHACVWKISGPGGPYGALDSCYTAEGGCFSQTQPNYGGTIMSYCHLNGEISFYKGFGSAPGDSIRRYYDSAFCLTRYVSSLFPTNHLLKQNYPNPFNPGTTIEFDIAGSSIVSLIVYDISGKEIGELVSNQVYSKGTFTKYFNPAVFNLSSGIYFYRLVAKDIENTGDVFTEVKKMILIK